MYLKDAKSRNGALYCLNKKPVANLRNVARAKFVAEARAALKCRTSCLLSLGEL